jgi:hypothetical protein
MNKAFAALLLCLMPSAASYPESSDMKVAASALPIDPNDPAHRRFGRLLYLGGWHLTSRQPNFGGYSALHVEGDRFFALSDGGYTLRFRMARPGVIDEVRFGELPAFPAYDMGRHDRDSESMTIGPQGDVWVGFEYRNAILRYPADLSQLHSIAWPPAMKDWSANSGPEAMVRLEGGRFLVFAEGKAVGPGTHAALMFPGDPTNPKNVPFQFGYKPPKGFVPTDAAQLPDGRVVLVNRRFGTLQGFSAALAIVDPAKIAPGAVVVGEPIGELAPPLNVDNMEGISVTREGGRTIIWLISDDNQLAIERTLLLKFELRQ